VSSDDLVKRTEEVVPPQYHTVPLLAVLFTRSEFLIVVVEDELPKATPIALAELIQFLKRK